MLYKYLNIYFGHQTSFFNKSLHKKNVRTAYSQLPAFATNSDHRPPLSLKTLNILGCLDEFIADVLTDTGIALDHKLHIYDPRHEVCSELFGNPEDRFAHDAAHIKRFFTICATFIYSYIGKGFTINTTLVSFTKT